VDDLGLIGQPPDGLHRQPIPALGDPFTGVGGQVGGVGGDDQRGRNPPMRLQLTGPQTAIE
jgi:hypothetical protein